MKLLQHLCGTVFLVLAFIAGGKATDPFDINYAFTAIFILLWAIALKVWIP